MAFFDDGLHITLLSSLVGLLFPGVGLVALTGTIFISTEISRNHRLDQSSVEELRLFPDGSPLRLVFLSRNYTYK